MKRMIVAALLLVSVFIFGSGWRATAEGSDGTAQELAQEAPYQFRLARMTESLGLNDTQKEQIGAIMKAQWEKNAPLRQQLRASMNQLREAALAETFDEDSVRTLADSQSRIRTELIVSRAKAGSQIRALLTPEQRELAKKFLALKRGGPGHRPPFDEVF